MTVILPAAAVCGMEIDVELLADALLDPDAEADAETEPDAEADADADMLLCNGSGL